MTANADYMLPQPGSMLTYKEAIMRYDNFESAILEKAYGKELLPVVSMYDLLWEIDSLACKYGIEDSRTIRNLKMRMYEYSAERTALANGINGKRFYLMKKPGMLEDHNATHLFEVKIDGSKLEEELRGALNALAKEAKGTDEYSDTYSPDWPDREIKREKVGDKVLRWITLATCALMVCFGISMVVHSVFQIGVCSRWFI